MATQKNSIEQLDAALQNPNVRKYLEFLKAAEGTGSNGYNVNFGGSRLQDFSDHPGVSRPFRQTDGKINRSTAAGAYQYTKGTWDGLKKQYGFQDFSPINQDRGAVALLIQNGSLGDVASGNFTAAINKDGGTWASLPSSKYAQPKKSWAFAQNFFNGDIDTSQIGQPSMTPQANQQQQQQLAQNQQSAQAMRGAAQWGNTTQVPFQPFQTRRLQQGSDGGPQLANLDLRIPEIQNPGTLQALSAAAQPFAGRGQNGTLGAPIQLNGRNVLAIPSTAEERQVFNQVANTDYDDATKNDIIRAFAQIQPVRNNLLGQDMFGTNEPTMLDSYLQDIVENV